MNEEKKTLALVNRVYGNLAIDRPHITHEFVDKTVREYLMRQRQQKTEAVLGAIVELTQTHGRVYFGIDTIVEKTGVPEIELYNHDNFTGILMDLNDAGKIVVERGKKPDVCLDADFLC